MGKGYEGTVGLTERDGNLGTCSQTSRCHTFEQQVDFLKEAQQGWRNSQTQSTTRCQRMWTTVWARLHRNLFPSSTNGHTAWNPGPYTTKEVNCTTNGCQRRLPE